MQILIVALILCALACLVSGIFLLAGPGWALVSAAACQLLLAQVILRGAQRMALKEGGHAGGV